MDRFEAHSTLTQPSTSFRMCPNAHKRKFLTEYNKICHLRLKSVTKYKAQLSQPTCHHSFVTLALMERETVLFNVTNVND